VISSVSGLRSGNQSVAIVPASLGVNSFKEFVELAKAKPRQLGNPGVGSSSDLTARRLFQRLGLKLERTTEAGRREKAAKERSAGGGVVKNERRSCPLTRETVKGGPGPRRVIHCRWSGAFRTSRSSCTASTSTRAIALQLASGSQT
jgi:hypothetical protein